MNHNIKTVYVIHHSHTDIGYTDLQERVVDSQIDYIRSTLALMKKTENAGFRWNCETLFCVEEFFKAATDDEKRDFFSLAKDDKLGLSAIYLNFCDLLDCDIYGERLAEWVKLCAENGIRFNTAMCADINGISMGQRDAMINNGVEFLFMNIHCHHGMYPLYQNQNAFLWENAAGKRLLVWNGEHYNLGNVLGFKPTRGVNFMQQNHFGGKQALADPVDALCRNLDEYLALCEANGYQYDFIVSGVSGVFSDNAPPEPEILRTIEGYNKKYSDKAAVKMVSLQELYAEIAPKLQNSPVYRGDLTDWWANGAGSTPYAVKHYKDAQYRYQLCKRLDSALEKNYPELTRAAQDNLLIYAEHTWGHSSTIDCPCDTMVLNLDMRKNSYASKAHEAASRMLNRIAQKNGDIMRYYNTNGAISVHSVSNLPGLQPVEFYIESPHIESAEITDESGRVITCQVSPHPRGRKITFVDLFEPREKKNYRFKEIPASPQALNSRKAYVGSERIRDIINDYDPVSYRLPYEAENDFFHITYRPNEGITGFIDKRNGQSLLEPNTVPFFTPIYEMTEITQGGYEERRLLGRNIRGKHAKLYAANLEEIVCMEQGDVFTLLKLRYTLEGTILCNVYIKLYSEVPRIDFRLELGKTISTAIESVFMPMTLSYPQRELYMRKGAEAFQPGIDQIPGSCMEYFMSDKGLAFISEKGGALVAARDTALFYTGEMRHHAIRLCDNKPENNLRPVYSWVMNNMWETNFKMDLSGFCEYCYSLWLTDETDGEKAMDELFERTFDPYVLIVE